MRSVADVTSDGTGAVTTGLPVDFGYLERLEGCAIGVRTVSIVTIADRGRFRERVRPYPLDGVEYHEGSLVRYPIRTVLLPLAT